MTPEESRVAETYAETCEALARKAHAHQVWVWKMTLSGRHTTAELRTLGWKEGMKVAGMRRAELVQALAEVYAAREPSALDRHESNEHEEQT